MLRRLCSVAVGVILAAASPLVAHGATVSVIDDQGDVWKDTRQGESAAPQQRRGDIRRITITHTDRTVLVRMKFDELERTGAWFSMDVALRTKSGLARKATVLGGSKSFFGKPLWKGVAQLARSRGREVQCAVTHNIDYATNVIRMRVPRSCLNAPRWVQARGTYFSARYGKTPAGFFDSAHTDEPKLGAWSKRIRRA